MASGTGVASLPCLQEHPICRSPGGIPFWREARRASIPPGGLGTHPIPHILPRWEVLTASPGRDGIPLEGQDTCPGRCPDSPSSNCAVSISAITESSRARPRTPGKAGQAPLGPGAQHWVCGFPSGAGHQPGKVSRSKLGTNQPGSVPGPSALPASPCRHRGGAGLREGLGSQQDPYAGVLPGAGSA